MIQVQSRQHGVFGDVADIKVGIKTTADNVFVRDDWKEQRVESELLYPLITHHDTMRWKISRIDKQVLYPYRESSSKRIPIELGNFPSASAYLRRHHKQLESRKYIAKAGREWFEIWVPQQPSEWCRPKLVWPDISVEPKFCLDVSGAIVNGDCYWLKLKEGQPVDWLYLILAIANSSVATEFYDLQFHNKLYSGRRRFMTQYVRQFPLLDLSSQVASNLVQQTKRLLSLRREKSRHQQAVSLDRSVRLAFGLGSLPNP